MNAFFFVFANREMKGLILGVVSLTNNPRYFARVSRVLRDDERVVFIARDHQIRNT